MVTTIKKALLFLLVLAGAMTLNAQAVKIYKSGQVISYVTDADSVVFCEFPTAGFSVSEGKQVAFAKGNLQYTQSTRTWSFAPHQYSCIGRANATSDENGNIVLSDQTDLFGWSGDTGTAKWGVSASTDYNDYSGEFADWGQNVTGTDVSGTWRTLSKEEWYYLFFTRTNAQKLFGLGSVNDVHGLILLPDDWLLPTGAVFTPSTKRGLAEQNSYYTDSESHWDDNIYTMEEWHRMENAGAVFLPAAGGRSQKVSAVQNCGYYWSGTPSDPSKAYILYFGAQDLYPTDIFKRNVGLSIRLVRDL